MARERTRKAESLLPATNFNRRTERLCDMEEFEQLNIFDITLPKFRIDKPIRLIELFAGIGSQAMALRDLGADFEHHRVVEFDKFAIASYNAIHGTDFPAIDITKISGADLGITSTDKYCYLMTYSFPCQDLSVAGKQKGMAQGSGTRSGLLWEVERLLNEVKNLPQVLIMENVPQVHSQINMNDFQKWIEFLESKGYSNHWKDLNAKDYGVKQNRQRCFMVSILGNWHFKFPCKIPLKIKTTDYLIESEEKKHYIKNENVYKFISDIGKQKMIFQDVIVVKTREMRIAENNMCGTLTTDSCTSSSHNGSYGIIEGDRIRLFTANECWRLMGFSDIDFQKAEKVNSNSQLYKQAGNSIVKDVLIRIFRQLIA